jgi:uncharacterized Ntn-hydrolase superfamily protein
VTFSLVARCPKTGMLGMGISSSSPAVAARCAHVRAGVGAVATQNVTDPRLGPRLLEALAGGEGAAAALRAVVESEPHIAHRQLAVVDARGETGVWSGAGALGRSAARAGEGAVAAGNLLAGADVVDGMLEAFAAAAGDHLGARLLAALATGVRAGGEEGPVRSAGLLVADRVPWPVVDLRVDWHADPVGELGALWELWRPQIDDYVTRALRPDAAPDFIRG